MQNRFCIVRTRVARLRRIKYKLTFKFNAKTIFASPRQQAQILSLLCSTIFYHLMPYAQKNPPRQMEFFLIYRLRNVVEVNTNTIWLDYIEGKAEEDRTKNTSKHNCPTGYLLSAKCQDARGLERSLRRLKRSEIYLHP